MTYICYTYIHCIVFVLIPFISHVVAEQQLNPLSSPMEERRLEEVLSNLRSEVKKRRLLMYPYYRDYDMVGGRGGEGGRGRESSYVHGVWNAALCECVVAGGLLEGVRELYMVYIPVQQAKYVIMTVKFDIHIHKLHVNGFSVVYCAPYRRMRHIGGGWQALMVCSPEKYQEQTLTFQLKQGDFPKQYSRNIRMHDGNTSKA